MKVVNYILINGEPVLLNSLSKEKQDIIGKKLNRMALESVGYTQKREKILSK